MPLPRTVPPQDLNQPHQLAATMRHQAPPKVDWQNSAAFLSFEGTLAPLQNKPGVTHLPAREKSLLRTLVQRCRGAVAILAGRQLSELQTEVPGTDVILCGSHGAEIDIDGDPKIMPGVEVAIDRCFPTIKALAAAEGLPVQRRSASIAISYMGCPEGRGRAVRLTEKLSRKCQELAPTHGHMVSELTPREYSKGTALMQIINHPGFAGRRPVAIGCDATGEAAIRAAQSIGGMGLRIGGGATQADFVFATQVDFLRWLERSLQ